jgi:hypothetical protein
MEQDILTEQLTRKGSMTTKPWLMSPSERATWESQIQKNTRAYLFSIGQPLVYKKNGRYIAEYADGSIKELE